MRQPGLFGDDPPAAAAPLRRGPPPELLEALWRAVAARGGHGMGWAEALRQAPGPWLAVQSALVALVAEGRLEARKRERSDGGHLVVLFALQPKEGS